MIERLLSMKDFSIYEFLSELEKSELLFLLFLSSHEREDIELIFKTDDVEQLLKFVEKTVAKKTKKIPKEELVKQIGSIYKNVAPNFYKYIYLYSFDDTILYNPKLVALEKFVSLVFSKKIDKLEEEFITGKSKNKKIDKIEELQKKIIDVKRPIMNTVGLVSLLGKADYILESVDDNFISREFREMLFGLLFEQFEEININKFNQLEGTIKKQQLDLKNKQRDFEKKEEALSKAKEQNRTLSIELKEIKKERLKNPSVQKKEIDHELTNKLTMDIQQRDKEIQQFKNKKEEFEEQFEIIDKLRYEIKNMEVQEKEKTMEYVNVKRKLDVLESKTIETYLEEYIESNGFTKRLYVFIEPLVKEYQKKVKAEEEKLKLEKLQLEEENKLEQKVGYCLIEKGVHYAVFPDNTRIQIQDIPDYLYLGQGQFVKVELNGTFKWAYGYKYEESDRDYLINEFGSVIYRRGEPHLMKAVWVERKIEKIPSSINLKDNQVVSINAKGEFLRFYRSLFNNADHFLDSIKAKGHEAYYVIQIFPNGMLLRNIETGVEEFKAIETNGKEVKEQQILCVNDNQLVYVFFSAKFYTFSSFYKKSEHGVVELKNDVVFVRKLSEEVVIVNEIPDRIQLNEGDIIIVDECNNYMTIKKEAKPIGETDEHKKLYASSKTTSYKKNTEKIAVEKEVLILGKVTYENSYKMSLYKKGYRAEVIEGYEPWTKVKSSLKGKDMVVVVTEFISHENMWKIKGELQNIPVIYSEFDGANRIVEQIDEMFKNENAM